MANTETKTSAKSEKPATPAVRITAKRDGFRRAGRAHAGTPTDYPAGTFTPEQLEQLRAEPMLVVEILAAEKK